MSFRAPSPPLWWPQDGSISLQMVMTGWESTPWSAQSCSLRRAAFTTIIPEWSHSLQGRTTKRTQGCQGRLGALYIYIYPIFTLFPLYKMYKETLNPVWSGYTYRFTLGSPFLLLCIPILTTVFYASYPLRLPNQKISAIITRWTTYDASQVHLLV